MSSKSLFLKTVDEAVKSFPSNRMCAKLDEKKLTLKDYHSILLMIFHQTYQGPSTFSLAAAHCDPRLHEARDYLIHHSDEEKSHWQWVINDLKKTGYTGPDPREDFPPAACQAYIAFNIFTAIRFPLGRLGIATVLESIGASYGKKYAMMTVEQLKLTTEQTVFFFGHGDTDVGHTADLLRVIEQCPLTEYDWKWMCHAARTAGVLYKNMYNEAVS